MPKRSMVGPILLSAGAAAIVLAVSIPDFIKSRSTASNNLCMNNLRRLDGAKEYWALQMRVTNGFPSWEDVLAHTKDKTMPQCHMGGSYTLGRIGEDPKCSYRGHALPK